MMRISILALTALGVVGVSVVATGSVRADDANAGDRTPFAEFFAPLFENFGVKVGGHLEAGISTANNNPWNFNQPNDQIVLNQGWFYAERVADGSKGLDFGFRFDVVYGVDALETQSFGNHPGVWDYMNGFQWGEYGFAIPQLYGEVAAGNLNVKVGHFYTLIGYEVVPATGNFFYSHSYTMFNSEPFTHTGVLASYQATDNVKVYGGWTLGWDTGFDQLDGGSNFLGGVAINLNPNTSLTYATTFGNFGQRGKGYSHSLVLDVMINDRFKTVLQTDYLTTTDNLGMRTEQFGIVNYLFYEITKTVQVGTRLEWWKTDDPWGSFTYAGATLGLNVRPCSNFVMRPEIRFNWTSDPNIPNETVFGVDAVLTY